MSRTSLSAVPACPFRVGAQARQKSPLTEVINIIAVFTLSVNRKTDRKAFFLKDFSQFFEKPLKKPTVYGIIAPLHRGIAQLVEYWSPKPRVVGSNPSAPAIKKRTFVYQVKVRFFRLLGAFSGEIQQNKGKMRVGAVIKAAAALIFLPAGAQKEFTLFSFYTLQKDKNRCGQ